MKKTIYAMLMASLMLVTVFGAFSVNAAYIGGEGELIGVPVAPCNTTYIYGGVYDADTEEPIEGATVEIYHWLFGRFNYTTASDGHYYAAVPSSNCSYIMSARKSGYLAVIKTVFFPPDKDSFQVDFYLKHIFLIPLGVPDPVTNQLTSTPTRQSRTIR